MGHTLSGKGIHFMAGFADAEQLSDWFAKNPRISGFCFIGRSNVGKSTLINTLFNHRITRTSNAPGRTRQINLFQMEECTTSWNRFPVYLFDLPGHGYAKVPRSLLQNWNRLMDRFFNLIPNSLAVVEIQDARRLNQKSDEEFFNYFQNYNNKIFLLFNKIDKLKNQKEKQLFKKQKATLLEKRTITDAFCISAKKRQGIKELESSLISFLLNLWRKY